MTRREALEHASRCLVEGIALAETADELAALAQQFRLLSAALDDPKPKSKPNTPPVPEGLGDA